MQLNALEISRWLSRGVPEASYKTLLSSAKYIDVLKPWRKSYCQGSRSSRHIDSVWFDDLSRIFPAQQVRKIGRYLDASRVFALGIGTTRPSLQMSGNASLRQMLLYRFRRPSLPTLGRVFKRGSHRDLLICRYGWSNAKSAVRGGTMKPLVFVKCPAQMHCRIRLGMTQREAPNPSCLDDYVGFIRTQTNSFTSRIVTFTWPLRSPRNTRGSGSVRM